MEHTSRWKDVEESGQGNCPLPELGRAENPLALQGFQKELLGLSCSRACPEWIPSINLLRINPNPPPHFHCHPRLDLHDPTPRWPQQPPSRVLPAPAWPLLPSTTQQPSSLFPLQPHLSLLLPLPLSFMFLPPTSIMPFYPSPQNRTDTHTSPYARAFSRDLLCCHLFLRPFLTLLDWKAIPSENSGRLLPSVGTSCIILQPLGLPPPNSTQPHSIGKDFI